MQVSNPNNVADKAVVKKSSLFGSLLGFFYDHTKGILLSILLFVISFAFLESFFRELDVYKAVRFSMMNPVEIVFIGLVGALFSVIKIFVPILFVCMILKVIMIKMKGLKIEYLFNKTFRIQLLFSFFLSFMFAVIFFADILVLTQYSPKLITTSLDIFVISFVAILMTVTSLTGVLRGVDFIVEKKHK